VPFLGALFGTEPVARVGLWKEPAAPALSPHLRMCPHVNLAFLFTLSAVESTARYVCFSRKAFNAPPQAMTWSSMALTDCSCWGAGLKTLKFSKSVKSERPT
jgi:hypothetical protein